MTGVEPNLLLIGLRGSGKSTLARALAERQGRSWFDLDELVRAEFPQCATIAEIFAEHGESAFREREAAALRSMLEVHQGVIIALGGGTPTAPGAVDQLRESGTRASVRIVYLRYQPETLRERLMLQDEQHRADRPSLTGGDPLDEIEALFEQRDALYRELASRTLDEPRSINGALEELETWMDW